MRSSSICFLLILMVAPLLAFAQPNNDPPAQCDDLDIETAPVQCVIELAGDYEYVFSGEVSYCVNCRTDSVYSWFAADQQDSVNKLYENVSYDHEKIDEWMQCVNDQVIEEALCGQEPPCEPCEYRSVAYAGYGIHICQPSGDTCYQYCSCNDRYHCTDQPPPEHWERVSHSVYCSEWLQWDNPEEECDCS